MLRVVIQEMGKKVVEGGAEVRIFIVAEVGVRAKSVGHMEWINSEPSKELERSGNASREEVRVLMEEMTA